MKQLLNIHTLIALVFASVLFAFLYQLNRQPLRVAINTFNYAMEKSGDKPAYTNNYIKMVRSVYGQKLKQRNVLLDTMAIDNDSLFMISLQQIVKNFSVNANPYPIVEQKKDESLWCSFQMIARKNVTLRIQLKKVNESYVFNEISNLNMLLSYHPEYLADFVNEQPH